MTRHITVTITEMQARTIVNLLEDSNDCIIPMSSTDIRSVRALARNLRQQVARLDEELSERYYRTTRARETGTLVTTGHADDLGLERGLSDYDGVEYTLWYNVCEAHGSIVGHQTLALAKSFAASPKDWCEHCAAGDPRLDDTPEWTI